MQRKTAFKETREATSRSVTTAIVVALLLGLAAYARLTNLAGVFGMKGRVMVAGLDSHYHLRRVQLTLNDFPRVPTFDAWANAPEGATLDWPIGFDLALAAICGVAHWIVPGPRTVESVAALFDPAIGVFVCLLVFRLGNLLGGRTVGWLATLLAAVLPMLSGYAMVGRVDHHAVEPALVLLALPPLLRLVSGPRERLGPAIALGLIIPIAIIIWPGAIVIGALVAASLALEVTVLRDLLLTRRSAIVFGLAAVVMVPLALLHPWAWQGRLVYTAPSWLQPLLFALAAVFFGSGALVLRRSPHTSRLKLLVLALLPVLVITGCAMALSTDLRASLNWAVTYLSTAEAQISQVTESRPLLAQGLQDALTQYTWLAPFAPLLLLHALARTRRCPQGRVLALWLFVTLGLALAQLRLGSLLAPLWCVTWSLALRDLYAWLRSRSRNTGAWLPRTSLGLALGLLLLPTMALHQPMRFIGTAELVSTLDALAWLRVEAKSAGNVLQAQATPRFTVLAPWQWGHWITYLGHQANVANPLGQTPTNLRGVRDSAGYFLSQEPAQADRILVRRRARYVLVTPLFDQAEQLARHLGLPAGRFLQHDENEGRTVVRASFYTTMAARLLHFDGRRFRLRGREHPPLRDMRLVYSCRRRVALLGRSLNYCKIFERVRGATIEGCAPPGSATELVLPLHDDRRGFAYRDRTIADSNGRFVVRVPYPTERTNDAHWQAGGPYVLHPQGTRVDVSVQAVRRGDIITTPECRSSQ